MAPVPCGPYQCVESPVDWFIIDVLAIITVLWIIATFLYKGVKQYNVTRYPQMQIIIPYGQWESKLLANKPPMGAGRVISAFFKTLFVDVLAMNILKCEFGKSEKEIVRTRTAKRVAKLLMVWGFVFAGIATTVAYITFPHNMIVLDFTHPARIAGMLGGVFMVVGALIWLSVRYKEVNYRGIWDWLGAEYLPIMVLLLSISGFVLQGAILAWAYYGEAAEAFLTFAIHFHAIPVALFFWAFFWTKADHIVYRIFWRIYEYADKELAGANTRLPPATLKPLNKTGKEIQPGY
ncbi:hypothetical protein [Pyrobaculum aerophilum]|uniref:Uncharacterized protein n=1 Tax=Pyrobaculum aerophilum TaxID=13773 RepID=A0A371QZQ7_9CREN|nr:hypothetical protein [Pyrobaculum aerophilum]RFA96321.1 hypothetical protein CGL51_05015 [Pyrobaculum aerophilum]RFA96921.1 hypothetical protein CGL52_10145 [Pyrobaculum aerophilum]